MAAAHYHTYKDPYTATLSHPQTQTFENIAEWPKSYKTPRANKHRRQGLHPGNEALPFTPGAVPNPAYAQWYSQYYTTQQPQPQAGYWVTNGQYYPSPIGTSYTSPYYHQPPIYPTYSQYPPYQAPPTPIYYGQWPTSWPTAQPQACPPYDPYDGVKRILAASTLAKQYSYPRSIAPGAPMAPLAGAYAGMYPSMYPGAAGAAGAWPFAAPADPATTMYQAAQAAAANAALAAMPQAPNYYVGTGQTDFMAQQAYLMAHMGLAKPPPDQMAPFKPIDGAAFWCKETDGTFTMRAHVEIAAGDLSPGHWERSPTSGYFWWVRDG